MDQNAFGAYLVVKILSKNRNGLKKYECVPNNWVKVKDNNDSTVVFGYPLEDRLDTRMRVIEYQALDASWPTIFGDVLFHTDSQEDAFRFLETKMQHECNVNDQWKETVKQDDKEVTFANSSEITKSINQCKKKRGRKPKQDRSDQEVIKQNGGEFAKELELEILGAHELIRTYASDFVDEAALCSSTPNSSNIIKKPDTTQILQNETVHSLDETLINKQNASKITQRPKRKCSRFTQNFSGYKEYSDEDVDTSDDSNTGLEIVHLDHQDHPSGHSTPARDQELNISLLNDQIYSECYNFYVKFNESYQNSMSILDNAENYLQNIISKHKDNIAAKAKQSLSLPPNQQPDACSANEFSAPQPLLQERSKVSEEEARWTLRYPEPGPGIIELVPNTGVYVSKKGLDECKRINSETTKFTRGLLAEVFTDEALRNCSFTGVSRRKIRKNPKLTPKTGLDPKAREVFLTYVVNYSKIMGWDKANLETIMNCIKNRLSILSRFRSVE